MTINEKMTAIADEVRALSGATDTLNLDEMASHTKNANTEIIRQEELIARIQEALQGKMIGGSGVGILDIQKTNTVGLVDVYTIALTNGSTYTFTVTNGKDGIDGKLTEEQVELLDKFSEWYDKEHHVNMTGVFTATIDSKKVEIGSEIVSIFTWNFSKLPTTLSIDGVTQETPTQEGTTEEQKFTSLEESEETFTISGVYAGPYGDEKVSKTWTYKFQNKRYTGYAAEPATIDGDFIKSLRDSEFATSRGKTFNLNDNTAGKYIWYAYPARFNSAKFTMGGYSGGFEEPMVIEVVNEAGFTENYYLYRSTEAGVGDLEIIVK